MKEKSIQPSLWKWKLSTLLRTKRVGRYTLVWFTYKGIVASVYGDTALRSVLFHKNKKMERRPQTLGQLYANTQPICFCTIVQVLSAF